MKHNVLKNISNTLYVHHPRTPGTEAVKYVQKSAACNTAILYCLCLIQTNK